jgi:putative transposase
MRLVERHVIDKNHRFSKECDDLAGRSKNLYNYCNYLIRQSFIGQDTYLDNCQIYHEVKSHEAYKALPAKVSNQVLISLHRNWKSFFEAIKEWRQNSGKFLGRPKLPKYKDKTKGRFCVVYEKGAISKPGLAKGLVKLSKTSIELPTKCQNVQQVRIIPQCGQYVIEVVYEIEPQASELNPEHIAAIDMGVGNLAAVTSNQNGFSPVLINGKPLKALNQYFNKKKAQLQSLLKGSSQTSKRIQQLSAKRNNQVDSYLHKASRLVINRLIHSQIGTLVIGKNDLWKQESNMGRKNNQQFVSLPHGKLVEMLTYKAELVGIRVIITEESYTSKSSFLDYDPIPTYGQKDDPIKFSGSRVKRGLYKSANGTIINADVNGSYNILRKVFPTAIKPRDSGCAVRPIRIAPNEVKKASQDICPCFG